MEYEKSIFFLIFSRFFPEKISGFALELFFKKWVIRAQKMRKKQYSFVLVIKARYYVGWCIDYINNKPGGGSYTQIWSKVRAKELFFLAHFTFRVILTRKSIQPKKCMQFLLETNRPLHEEIYFSKKAKLHFPHLVWDLNKIMEEHLKIYQMCVQQNFSSKIKKHCEMCRKKFGEKSEIVFLMMAIFPWI